MRLPKNGATANAISVLFFVLTLIGDNLNRFRWIILRSVMKNLHLLFFTSVTLFSSPVAVGQQRPEPPKTVPDSINLIWKSVERDFTSLAEAMPEDKWSFKPAQGEFKDVRTFAEQVKHVACANEAWAKQMGGEKPPARCDLGGPSPAKSKAEILAYLHDSFGLADKAIA